jgi:dTDP-glucose 4,6-dehydratase
MKLLVTGNCGFIGQNFVRMFGGKYDVVGMDKINYASDYNASDLCPTLITDICSSNHIDDAFKSFGFDAIINFAAESHVDNSINAPDPFMYSNFIGTFMLLEAAKKYNVSRFIQISTDEVYGDLKHKDDKPFSTDSRYNPSSPYSASKAAADMLVSSYYRTYGLDTVIIRSCNNYGPYQFKEKFIPVIISNALHDRPIPLYGSGSNIREWIFVEDNCFAIEEILRDGRSGTIYHVGTSEEFSNRFLVEKILGMLDKPTSLINEVEDRKGHDFRYALECENELKWSPMVDISEGLGLTIDWIRDNPSYWDEDNL